MKKVFLAAALLIVSQAAFGQQGLFSRFHFGLKAGVNSSNFEEASFDTEMLTGFHAGAIVNFSLTDNWSIQQDFSTQYKVLKSRMILRLEMRNLNSHTFPYHCL